MLTIPAFLLLILAIVFPGFIRALLVSVAIVILGFAAFVAVNMPPS